ncbi:cytoplasmic FMR1 interacting protein [Klebsormidium nitens]|uniref:Cytoplasmic FMR1 interacting protein n=1 Tax=Klebsormidium nitens TaxID=105231 RepID=A0A1Y1I7X8_KLENI|nr:cytoplasmic FMR1 interacting protein [Klebsormidium nitens]|eukprot:GAQ86052.1 cytoplasmic FMR1 interacting protein [Klebsormidium nitens]
MERFATPLPCIYSDGEQEHVRGQLGIYSALTFKRFQQLMTQKTGVPAAQLSAVLAYKRSVGGEERRQKLNISEATNFGIVLRIHAKETDAHFVISLKRPKKDRKGAGRRRAADVDDEDDVRSEDPAQEPSDETDQRPAKLESKEPLSPVSTLPAFPAFRPPSPQSPDQDAPEPRQSPPAEVSGGTVPQETSSSNGTAHMPRPVLLERVTDFVTERSTPATPAKVSRSPEDSEPSGSTSKPVTILQRPSPPVASTSAAKADTPTTSYFPVHSSIHNRAVHGISPSPQEQSDPRTQSRQVRMPEQRAADEVTFSSWGRQHPRAPRQSVQSRDAFPHPSNHSVEARPHPSKFQGQPLGSPAHPAPEARPISASHVAKQAHFDGARSPHLPPRSPPPKPPQIVSASMFASAVNAAAEALAPRRVQHPERHVAGRAPGHVAVGGPALADARQRRELTPLEMAGLQGVLKDFAAATGRREGFAGFRKTCKFCVFCLERQRGPAPFHWCVDDRIVSGFRGPSPAGPIGRPVKRPIEAAA